MLIPGLPDDVALQCLIRVPRFCLVRLRCVSKTWNDLLGSRELYLLRRRNLLADDWLFLVASRASSPRANKFSRLLAYDFETGSSHRIIRAPAEAEKHLGLMGIGCASRDSRLFIAGGSSATPDGIEIHNHSRLTIFDAAAGSWSSGRGMELPRSYFACGFIDGTLYVAGGCDGERSTEAYDGDADRWTRSRSMPFGFSHIESSVVFKRRLYVKGVCKSRRRMLVLDPSSSDVWIWQESLEADLREGELVATDENLYVINPAGYVGRMDDAGQGWRDVGVVSRCFLPFAAPSPSSARHEAMFFRNDVFFVTARAGEDVSDLKCSRQLHRALLVAFYRCQSALLRF